MVRLEGREGRQWGAAPYNLSLQRKRKVYNLFCCPECKEEYLDKHKNKYDVNENILEDFSDIPFKLSDRIGPNLKDLDGAMYALLFYQPILVHTTPITLITLTFLQYVRLVIEGNQCSFQVSQSF